MRWARFKRKRHITNPKKGPIHYRAPSRVFFRVVRGMIPHKRKKCSEGGQRGQMALTRLKCFDGTPAPYDTCRRMIVPEALKVLRLKPFRKFCVLGRLAQECGWNYGPLIAKLEEQRKVKSAAFYEEKKAASIKAAAAAAKADTSAVDKVLAQYGY